MEMKFYRCAHCGKIIAVVKESGVPVMCCGQKMQEIIPGTTDASVEKHVPVVEVIGDVVKVKVGAVAHPMLPEHYIEWVSLKTKFGNQRKAPLKSVSHATAALPHKSRARWRSVPPRRWKSGARCPGFRNRRYGQRPPPPADPSGRRRTASARSHPVRRG